jgi:chromosome segregation ATPase
MHLTGTRTIPRLAVASVVAALFLAGSPNVAAKKDDGSADQKIQAMTVAIKKLEVLDKRNAATAEIGQAEALRDKARSLIGKRKGRDALAATVDELEATVALAEGKIIEADKQAAVDARKAKLAQVRKELQQVNASLAKLEKEQAALQKKLGGGK